MSSVPFLGKVPKMHVIYMTRRQEKRTVTEEDCTCNRDPVDGGHTPDCNRMKPNQTCERVTVCGVAHPHNPPDHTDCNPPCDGQMRCARHGCPWPEEGECPTKERPLGRPPLGTTGGPFPVG